MIFLFLNITYFVIFSTVLYVQKENEQFAETFCGLKKKTQTTNSKFLKKFKLNLMYYYRGFYLDYNFNYKGGGTIGPCTTTPLPPSTLTMHLFRNILNKTSKFNKVKSKNCKIPV